MTLEQVKTKQITSLNNDWQGAYYPVPQMLSDSDSEKEIIHKHDANCKTDFDFACKNNVSENSFNNHKILPKDKPLSGISKCLFVFSILLCILTPVTFVWVLPCPEVNQCPLKVFSWEKQLDNIEYFGKINDIKSKSWHSHFLAILYKQDIQTMDKLTGVIAFTARNGEIAWNFTVDSAYKLDCTLTDATKDKIKDCLIESSHGIHMIDGTTGLIIWEVAKNNFFYKDAFIIDFPVILSDLDGDNVDDILVISNDKVKSVITIISGQTGDLLSQIEMGTCQNGHIVHSEKTFVVFSCVQHGQITQFYNITSAMLASKITLSNTSLLQEKINFFQNTDKFIYKVNGHVLKFKNEGVCPVDCRVTISLSDKNSSKDIAAFMYTNSYLLQPVVFSFKATESNLSLLKGHVSGFVLKLWEWFDTSSFVRAYVTEFYSLKGNHSTRKDKETVKVNFIKERVMIITLNETNLHVINVSLTEVVQLCFWKGAQHICQPDIASQKDSLLIEDLDYDGSKELVSYSTSFVNVSDFDNENKWKLVSNVKVVRLESELPKLYNLEKK